MTAAELARRLANDPVFQRGAARREAELQERIQPLRVAEQPIVRDLRAAGYDVSSVWDLGNRAVPRQAALPILLDHLQRGGYPDPVMESLGQTMAVREAHFAWPQLRTLYLQALGPREQVGLAAALAASATRDEFEALVALLGEESGGESRILFLRPIKRVGGQRGIEVIESLRDDPVFGKEATALLNSRSGS